MGKPFLLHALVSVAFLYRLACFVVLVAAGGNDGVCVCGGGSKTKRTIVHHTIVLLARGVISCMTGRL